MWTTSAVLRLLASSQMAWMALVLAHDHRRDRSAQATVFFLVCCVAHTMGPLVLGSGLPAPATDLFTLLVLLLPYSFWLLAKVHFDDEFRFCDRHLALLLIYVAIGYGCWRGLTGRWPAALLPGAPDQLWHLVPRVLGLALLAHALITIYVDTRSDLVVSRLKLRYGVLWLSGTYILVELLAEAFVLGSPAEAAAGMVNAAATFVIVFGLTAASVRIRPDILRPPRLESDAPVLDRHLADRLRVLVDDEQVFRQEGLTIGALAERLDAHEHKVRHLINDQLGFRNFNAFLNHYRIRDAQRALADPSRRHLNVAEVAYEVGYRSLGPFNKAFKDATGLTPTEFRASRTAPGHEPGSGPVRSAGTGSAA